MEDKGFWAGLLAALKDLVEPKIKRGDSIPGMPGGRANSLLNGGTCMSSSESKLFATYVEKMTKPGDPLRSQYSYSANEQRRIGASPIGLLLVLAIIIIALLIYRSYGSQSLDLEMGETVMEKYESSQKCVFDTIEHIDMKPSGRAIITKKFRVSKNRDEIQFKGQTYRVNDPDSQEALWRIAPDKRIENTAILYFANYTLYIYDQFVETELCLYERRKDGYYVYDEINNKAIKAYAAEGVNDGAFANYAIVIKDTNVILQFK